ncbi:uncharacterized protein LOC133834434 [Humulus lupulus]|uniref:uncharacterized protein LOC133834434 n=1 Tax=Humulus lupulus TaxID=3486 RepID=UPI002B407C69|nr:uncharacterized protein LOC133834434 [Humulus lupulus]
MVSTGSAGDNLSIESLEKVGPIDDDFETDKSDDDRDSPPSVKMHATLKKMKTRSPPSVKPRTNKKLKIVDEAVLVQDAISDSDPIPESQLIKDWEFFSDLRMDHKLIAVIILCLSWNTCPVFMFLISRSPYKNGSSSFSSAATICSSLFIIDMARLCAAPFQCGSCIRNPPILT